MRVYGWVDASTCMVACCCGQHFSHGAECTVALWAQGLRLLGTSRRGATSALRSRMSQAAGASTARDGSARPGKLGEAPCRSQISITAGTTQRSVAGADAQATYTESLKELGSCGGVIQPVSAAGALVGIGGVGEPGDRWCSLAGRLHGDKLR